MLKQGTKLVSKGLGLECYIGGVCGEVYFIFSEDGDYLNTTNQKSILETFTIIEEKWEPKDGREYWFVQDIGLIDYNIWTNDSYDKFRRDYLGIYQTKEDAQTARENMKKIS